MKKENYDDLWTALTKVVKDETATDKEKLEMIETYLEVYADNNTPSLEDVL